MDYDYIDGFPEFSPKDLKKQISILGNYVEWNSFDEIKREISHTNYNRKGKANVIGHLSKNLLRDVFPPYDMVTLVNESTTVYLTSNDNPLYRGCKDRLYVVTLGLLEKEVYIILKDGYIVAFF